MFGRTYFRFEYYQLKSNFGRTYFKFEYYELIVNLSQILEELILNLHYTDEDQQSETIVYSFQVIEKILN